MNFVEPIRDRKKIAQIKNLLRGQERFRDLLLFVVGINTALRISGLLQLQVLHFVDEQGHIRQRFWIKEQKRGKRQEVVVNESIREALEEYFAAYPGIARVSGSKIVLDGTTIEEVKKYHRDTLILCVEKANEEEAKLLERKHREEARQRQKSETQRRTVEDIADELSFD
jgi:integrase